MGRKSDSMASSMTDLPPSHAALIDELTAIVGPNHCLTDPDQRGVKGPGEVSDDRMHQTLELGLLELAGATTPTLSHRYPISYEHRGE